MSGGAQGYLIFFPCNAAKLNAHSCGFLSQCREALILGGERGRRMQERPFGHIAARVPVDRPGHLVFRAGAAGRRHRGAPARPRPRHEPHRHGRALRLRRRRGDRRRGDRRPARRGLPGFQGDAAERLAPRHDRRLRGLAQAAEDRPARLLPAALARPLTRWRRPSPPSRISCAPARSCPGASAISTRPTWKRRRASPATGPHRLQPGALPSRGARHRASRHPLVRGARRRGGRLQPVRPRRFPGPQTRREVLAEIAAAHGATPRQVALAFLTRRPSLFAIPKAADRPMSRRTPAPATSS